MLNALKSETSTTPAAADLTESPPLINATAMQSWHMQPSAPEKSAPGWKPIFKNLLMAPVFPMIGYLLLDRTGISHFLVQAGWIPKIVLGEGFGHVGLCFSLHYVVNAVKALSQQLFLRAGA